MIAGLGQKLVKAFSKLNQELIVSDETIQLVIKEVTMALLSADVNVNLVKQLRDEVNDVIDPKKVAEGANRRDLVRNAVIDQLRKMVDPEVVAFKPKKNTTNIIMFVGLQGSGKTTTVAKYAKFYQKRGFKVGVVCADTFRAGAYDQLQMNAAKIHVPFYGEKTERDPLSIAQRGVEKLKKDGYGLIVVDTSGRHMQSKELLDEMEQVSDRIHPSDIVLVMDSTIGQSAFDQAQAFHNRVKIGSIIITKLDGHAKGGGALAAVAATHSPITFLGTGEDFDSFQTFDPSSFVSRLVGGGDIRGVVEKLEGMDLLKKSPEIFESMVGGEFCMNDMKKLFDMFEQAGPITQMMEMFPGKLGEMFGEMREKTGGGTDKETKRRMKMFLVIIDSMNDRELASTKILPPERLRRIARGSGQPLWMCEHLMNSFKMFAKMGSNLKPFLKKGMSASDLAEYNPFDEKGGKLSQEQLRALQRMVPQGAMKNMGGINGLQNMMKQMSNMKGMGGFGKK